jgi:hypothetical protein
VSFAGWIPFLEPMHSAHHWWYLLMVPLAFGVSMIYKAVRMQHLDRYWRHVVIMTVQIIAGLIGLALALGVLVEWLIPLIPV